MNMNTIQTQLNSIITLLGKGTISKSQKKNAIAKIKEIKESIPQDDSEVSVNTAPVFTKETILEQYIPGIIEFCKDAENDDKEDILNSLSKFLASNPRDLPPLPGKSFSVLVDDVIYEMKNNLQDEWKEDILSLRECLEMTIAEFLESDVLEIGAEQIRICHITNIRLGYHMRRVHPDNRAEINRIFRNIGYVPMISEDDYLDDERTSSQTPSEETGSPESDGMEIFYITMEEGSILSEELENLGTKKDLVKEIGIFRSPRGHFGYNVIFGSDDRGRRRRDDRRNERRGGGYRQRYNADRRTDKDID